MRKILIGMIAVFFLGGSIALADMITFTTPSGSKDSAGDPVSTQAVVTTGSGTVTIQLTNMIQDQKDVGQSLTDFSFTLSNGTVSSTKLTTSSGSMVTVGTGGVISGTGPVSPVNWGFTTSGNTITVSWFDRSGPLVTGGGPTSGTLLGPASTSGYTSANGSIASNPAHNPFLNGNLDFTFDVTGVTSSTTASNAVFSFGTTEGDDIPGTPVPPSSVPEPASLSLLGIGLIGLGLVARRKFRRVA